MQKKGIEYFRGNLQRQMSLNRDILIETDRAVVMESQYPKAQYHFLVVAKEDIENVTKLTEDHLPLLDHMMELAHKIIEEKAKDLSSKFRIGFKTRAFMNRLNLHVISNDYFAFSMRRINHWNSFHTELFLPFQAAYLMLQIKGCVEEMADEKAEELKMSTPLKCVHCDFSTSLMVDLKAHLYIHWSKRESERDHQRLQCLTSVLEEIKLEETKKEAEKEAKEAAKKKTEENPTVQQMHPNNQMPPQFLNPGVSPIMKQQNGRSPNNPFRQPPHQYHYQHLSFPNQRPNFHPRGYGKPREAMNPGTYRMNFPNGPRQPHPNYNNTNNHRGGPRFPKNNPYEKPPQMQKQQEQKSKPSNPNPEKKDESNAAGTSTGAAAKPVPKQKWNKKKQSTQPGAGGAQTVAAGTTKSGSQPKPANT